VIGARGRTFDYEVVTILPTEPNRIPLSGAVAHAPFFGSAPVNSRMAVVVVPLNSPAVTLLVSFDSVVLPFTALKLTSTVDFAFVFQTSVSLLGGDFAIADATFAQFRPTVDFVFSVVVPDLTPPPVQPLIVLEVVIVGLTVTLDLVIGSAGENVAEPVIFVQLAPAAPAGSAAETPAGINNAIANNKPAALRIRTPYSVPGCFRCTGRRRTTQPLFRAHGSETWRKRSWRPTATVRSEPRSPGRVAVCGDAVLIGDQLTQLIFDRGSSEQNTRVRVRCHRRHGHGYLEQCTCGPGRLRDDDALVRTRDAEFQDRPTPTPTP